jgi:hypothetical protein
MPAKEEKAPLKQAIKDLLGRKDGIRSPNPQVEAVNPPIQPDRDFRQFVNITDTIEPV